MKSMKMFKAAFDQVAREIGGSSFLYIHRVREVLGWSKKRLN